MRLAINTKVHIDYRIQRVLEEVADLRYEGLKCARVHLLEDMKTEDERVRHYRMEKALARTLRNATAEERKSLYSVVYDELYGRAPLPKSHSNLAKKMQARRLRSVSSQVRDVRRFLTGRTHFLEIGPGDCALSLEVARHVGRVVAIDVSREVTEHVLPLDNLELKISDGTSIDVAPETINVAYGSHVMEHLQGTCRWHLHMLYTTPLHGTTRWLPVLR